VASVAPGSPAAKAGVVDNDVVTGIGSTPVPSAGVLIGMLANMKPGQVITLSWVHDDKLHHANLTLGTQPDAVNAS
jgi:S1-C subfamily serine protease